MHAHNPRLQSSIHLPEAWGSKSPKHADSLTGKQGGDPDRKGEGQNQEESIRGKEGERDKKAEEEGEETKEEERREGSERRQKRDKGREE